MKFSLLVTKYRIVPSEEKGILENAGVRYLTTRCGVLLSIPSLDKTRQDRKSRKPLLPCPGPSPSLPRPFGNPRKYLEQFSKEECVRSDSLGFW